MPQSSTLTPTVGADGDAAAPVQTLAYPPPPESYGRGWMHLVKVFGPGAVMASVTVGTGETVFAPRLGAIFGYGLLWAILAAVVFKGILVYTGGRHLVLTGEHPMEAWARFPGPRRWIPLVIGAVTIVSFPFWVAALSSAVANLCVWITGMGDIKSWGTAIVIVAMMLTLVQTYNMIEKVSTLFLALKVLFIFVAIVIVQPDWTAALVGLFVPQLPAYEPWVRESYPTIAAQAPLFQFAVFLGVVGGGVQDYIGYVSMMREKGWGLSAREQGGAYRLPTADDQIGRARGWLRAPQLDVVFSFVAVLVMTGSFMILGAALLHPSMQVPTDADLYSQQSRFLGVVHPSLVTVYKAGIFIAIFAAIYGTFEVYTRSAYEPLRAVFPHRDWKVQRLRVWITAYSGLGAILILWAEMKTVGLVEIISPLTGVLGCGLWCLAMVWVDRAQMPAPYRMTTRLLLATLLVGAIMVALGGWTAGLRWFG